MQDSQMWLEVSGDRIVNQSGEDVILKGYGLGGWMNMENFITGYPANEEAQREAILSILGHEKYEFFFEKFLEYFFQDADAAYIQSQNLNLLRLPINYRHFEEDMHPGVIKESGFKHLDRVIDICAKHQIYTIIDLHALQGYQNQDWHSDNPTHKALLWKHKDFQDRVVHLWEVIADRYKDQPWIAGYDLINEPADPTEKMVGPFYKRLINAVRAVDPKHIIFIEGNRYSIDFHMFDDLWDNCVYTNHDYTLPGGIDGGPYPGVTQGKYVDKHNIRQDFLKRSQFMLDNKLPIWVGEFGPVYLGDPKKDEMRYQLLKDQLANYDEFGVSWCIWLYKDIGLQAVTFPKSESPWMERMKPFLEKKARLAADCWGGLDTQIRHFLDPIEETFKKEFRDYDPFPFGVNFQVNRLVRHILFSEPLLNDYAKLFDGMSLDDIDVLMQSFLFKNCDKRERLARILSGAGE